MFLTSRIFIFLKFINFKRSFKQAFRMISLTSKPCFLVRSNHIFYYILAAKSLLLYDFQVFTKLVHLIYALALPLLKLWNTSQASSEFAAIVARGLFSSWAIPVMSRPMTDFTSWINCIFVFTFSVLSSMMQRSPSTLPSLFLKGAPSEMNVLPPVSSVGGEGKILELEGLTFEPFFYMLGQTATHCIRVFQPVKSNQFLLGLGSQARKVGRGFTLVNFPLLSIVKIATGALLIMAALKSLSCGKASSACF